MSNEICPVGTEYLLNRLGYVLDVRRTKWSVLADLEFVDTGLEGGKKIADVVVPAMLPERDLNCGVWPDVPRETLSEKICGMRVLVDPSMADDDLLMVSGNSAVKAVNLGVSKRRYVAAGGPVKAARELTYEDLDQFEVYEESGEFTQEQWTYLSNLQDKVMTSDQVRYRKHQALMILKFGDLFFERRAS